MAPTGKENKEIANISDLDSASTGRWSGRVELNRSSSNNTSSARRAATTENDDAFEITDIRAKLCPEVSENGAPFDFYLSDGKRYTGIPSLCGVETDFKNSQPEAISASANQSFTAKASVKSWKSTGKGKKRKKKKAGSKKRICKKHKTDDSMASVNEKNFVSKDDFAYDKHSFEFEGVNTNNVQGIAYKNREKTAGDGKQKAGTVKGGYVATQQTPGHVPGNSRVCCGHVQAHRGGNGGGGDDGDDGEGKPPRKPPDFEPCKNPGKKVKKKKEPSSGMDVDPVSSSDMNVSHESPDKEVAVNQLPQQRSASHVQEEQLQQHVNRPTQAFLMILHSSINHHNFCRKKPCNRCERVASMIRHHFDESNGTCSCSKCVLWLYVLEYHTGMCKLKDCIVCEKVKGTPKPTPVTQVIEHQATPSLDPDDLIVWRNEGFPAEVTHLKENIEYRMSLNSIGQGGHGTVYNAEVLDDVKKKCFKSCEEIVVKRTEKVEDDEKYVFEQTLNHPNLLETHLVLQKTRPTPHFRIFMEKCKLTVKDYLCKLGNDGKQLEMYEAMFYWTQTFDALKHLHHLRIPVIHKDVKAENVMLSIKDNLVRVKLGDYDTVKRLHHEYTMPGLHPKGTPGLIAPEVLRQVSHGRPADVWNMGMFLLQMLFIREFNKLQHQILALNRVTNMNKILFIHKTEELVKQFLREKMPLLKEMDDRLADLIQSCLSDDPSERPTAIEVLQHPAVTEYTRRGVDMNQLIRYLSQ